MANEELVSVIREYVDYIETQETLKICKCEWIYRDSVITTETRVRVRSHVSLECPLHSKEGLVLGFFLWNKTQVEIMNVLKIFEKDGETLDNHTYQSFNENDQSCHPGCKHSSYDYQ